LSEITGVRKHEKSSVFNLTSALESKIFEDALWRLRSHLMVELPVVLVLFKVFPYRISKIPSKSLFTAHGDSEKARSKMITAVLYKAVWAPVFDILQIIKTRAYPMNIPS